LVKIHPFPDYILGISINLKYKRETGQCAYCPRANTMTTCVTSVSRDEWTSQPVNDQHTQVPIQSPKARPSLLPPLQPTDPQSQGVSIESSPVWNTSCLVELMYNLIIGKFLCGKCPKLVTIQLLLPGPGVASLFLSPFAVEYTVIRASRHSLPPVSRVRLEIVLGRN